jgi:hypothetical protein
MENHNILQEKDILDWLKYNILLGKYYFKEPALKAIYRLERFQGALRY